jgi:hypothetical protein
MRPYEPPQLAVPTLMVDTSDGYKPSLELIVYFKLKKTEKADDGSSC